MHSQLCALQPFCANDLHHCQHKQRSGMLLMCEPPSRLGVRRTGTNCEEGLHSKRIVTHRIQEVRDDSFTKQRGPGMGRAENTASVQRKGGRFQADICCCTAALSAIRVLPFYAERDTSLTKR